MIFDLVLFAYLCGSIPFGKLVGRAYGIDIQKQGSGNIGFANVTRVLGWKAGLMVLPADVLKGVVPVLMARPYLSHNQLLLVGLMAILGHILPIWLRFKGGKGIATGLGVSLALSPILGCLALAVYLLTFAAVRQSAPSSIVGAASLVPLSLMLDPRDVPFYAVLVLISVWTHRSNLRTMLASA